MKTLPYQYLEFLFCLQNKKNRRRFINFSSKSLPRAKISALSVISSSSITSGADQGSVPTYWQVGSVVPSFCKGTVTPKSQSLTASNSPIIKTLAAFKSPWRILKKMIFFIFCQNSRLLTSFQNVMGFLLSDAIPFILNCSL